VCTGNSVSTVSSKLECALSVSMGWLRFVGSLKTQVSFAKEPYKREYMLQKRRMFLRNTVCPLRRGSALDCALDTVHVTVHVLRRLCTRHGPRTEEITRLCHSDRLCHSEGTRLCHSDLLRAWTVSSAQSTEDVDRDVDRVECTV